MNWFMRVYHNFSVGIVLGVIAMSVGMANRGRMVLMSGVVGAAATFGGPVVVDLMREIFR